VDLLCALDVGDFRGRDHAFEGHFPVECAGRVGDAGAAVDWVGVYAPCVPVPYQGDVACHVGKSGCEGLEVQR